MSEGALPEWGTFCEDQAHKLADSFKQDLRQFRLNNPQFDNVPTAGFARLFTATFLTHFEEADASSTRESHNAAAATSTTVSSPPAGRQKVWKSIFRRRESKDTSEKESTSTSTTSASEGRTRKRASTMRSSVSASTRSPFVEQPTVVMSANMNMLQFNNQSSDNFDNLSWSRCHVSLCLTHGMYQLLIRCPPKTSQPNMSLFCFLITAVRPTSNAEVPDNSSSFVVRAKGPVEYVFDAKSKEAMMSWVEAISKYAGVQEDNSLSNVAPVNTQTENCEVAFNERSLSDPSGQGGNHLTEFTPLFMSEQEAIPEELTVPSGRPHRSCSDGNLEMPRSAPVVRRVSDTSPCSSTNHSSPQQRAVTPPLTLPTRSHDDQTTLVSPELVTTTVLSTNQSASSRSLNTSFIDGPPVADNNNVTKGTFSSNNSSPTRSPTLRNSPIHGNSPLPPQQERSLSDLDSPQIDAAVDMESLRQHPWFHGMISRMDAALLVTQHGDSGTGEFLIRQSESRAGDLVLSFNYHGRAKHLRLSISSSGTCKVQHLEFRNILHMLEHFKSHPIPLESPGTTADIQLTSYLVVGTPVPNLPGPRMEPIGRSSSMSANTRLTDNFQSRTLSNRHNNGNGNVYVLT